MKNVDATMDSMECARFNYQYATIVQRMEKETEFSNTEIVSLAVIYHKFVLANGGRAKYMTILQLVALCDLMFHITNPVIKQALVEKINKFDPNITDSKFHVDRHVSPTAFIQLFAELFSNDFEQRMAFAFSMYDRTGRGVLDRKVVLNAVENFFSGDDEDEIFELRTDMVDLIFNKFDLDKDLSISFEEYCEVVRQQPGLLEFLGKVFPTKRELDVISLCANLSSYFETQLTISS